MKDLRTGRGGLRGPPADGRRRGWAIATLWVALAVIALAVLTDRSPFGRLPAFFRASAGSPSLESRALRSVRSRRHFVLPLNNPPVVAAADADYMRPDDIVLGVVTPTGARAYPRWLMVGYHVANDSIGDQPVLAAICEECSGGAAFVPIVGGESLDFRICGIRDGTFEICDFQTGSRWHPFTGGAHAGPLAGSRLSRLPVQLAYWQDWVRTEPGSTVVLGSPEQRRRRHGQAAAFGDGDVDPFLARGLRVLDGRLPADTLVFGLEPNPAAGALAIRVDPLLARGGLLQLDHGDVPVAVVAVDRMRVTGLVRRVGTEVLDLTVVGRTPVRLQDASGTVWDGLGRAVEGRLAGTRLTVAEGYLTEWYEWASTFPGTAILDL